MAWWKSNLSPLIDKAMTENAGVYIKSHVYVKSQINVEIKPHIEIHLTIKAPNRKTSRKASKSRR